MGQVENFWVSLTVKVWGPVDLEAGQGLGGGLGLLGVDLVVALDVAEEVGVLLVVLEVRRRSSCVQKELAAAFSPLEKVRPSLTVMVKFCESVVSMDWASMFLASPVFGSYR
ncbi:hypothetical protein STANM309S_06253 [Streptomyces tanashiensis]